MSIAVTGANGQLGRLILSELARAGCPERIVALVRSPDRAEGLPAELRMADYDWPETLATALAGIGTLMLISSNELGRRIAQHGAVIEAARTAGVKRIVYTSLLHADRSSLSLAADHLWTEQALAASGIDHVILRNGWYTENYTGGLDRALATGKIVGSAGAGRISSAPRADYAQAAAAVLLAGERGGQVYELAGDEAWTLDDLAAELTRQSGRAIAYQNLPEADYATALKAAGVPALMAAALASWDIGAARGDLFDDGGQLAALLGRPTTRLSEVVRIKLPATAAA